MGWRNIIGKQIGGSILSYAPYEAKPFKKLQKTMKKKLTIIYIPTIQND